MLGARSDDPGERSRALDAIAAARRDLGRSLDIVLVDAAQNVQDSGNLAGPFGGEDDVADPEVVVDDRLPRLGGHVRGQPGVDLREMRRRTSVVVRHQAADAAAVALVEALRPPEVSQSRGPPVHGVQVRERVGQRLADPPPERGRVQGRRRAGRDHRAGGEAHDVERHVDDLVGPGGREQPRDRHRRARERPDETCLAQHVVGARRGGRRRRTTDDNLARAVRDEKGQVGVPVADRPGRDLSPRQPAHLEEHG